MPSEIDSLAAKVELLQVTVEAVLDAQQNSSKVTGEIVELLTTLAASQSQSRQLQAIEQISESMMAVVSQTEKIQEDTLASHNRILEELIQTLEPLTQDRLTGKPPHQN